MTYTGNSTDKIAEQLTLTFSLDNDIEEKELLRKH